MNDKEMRIGHHGLPVDRFFPNTNTVYLFHGCFWHAHLCPKTMGMGEWHPVQKIRSVEVYAETVKKYDYIRSLGYNLISVFECESEWGNFVNTKSSAKRFIKTFFSAFYERKNSRTESEMIQMNRSGEYFELIRCDIHVPNHLTDKFSEMAQILKNTKISRTDL